MATRTPFTRESAWGAIGAQLARPLRAMTTDNIGIAYTVRAEDPRRINIQYLDGRVYQNRVVTLKVTIWRIDTTVVIDVIVPTPTANRFIAHNPGVFTVENQPPPYVNLSHSIQYEEDVENARENLFALVALWLAADTEPPGTPSPYGPIIVHDARGPVGDEL